MEDQTSSKDVQKSSRPTELNLLADIRDGLNQAKIAKKYAKSKATVSAWFKKIDGKFIKKAGYGTWELTELATELLNERGLPPSEIEKTYFIDGIMVTYDVRLKAELPLAKQWKVNNFATFSSEKMGDWTIRNNANKSITIIFPKIKGKDASDCIARAYFLADRGMRMVIEKYPQIEISNPVPRLSSGSVGSETLNKYLAPMTKDITIRAENYSIDNTPKRGTFEVKVDPKNPYQSADTIEQAISFLTNGGFKKEMEEIKAENFLMIQEIKGLTMVLSSFTHSFNEFIKRMQENMK
jgi:hypothetical protein